MIITTYPCWLLGSCLLLQQAIATKLTQLSLGMTSDRSKPNLAARSTVLLETLFEEGVKLVSMLVVESQVAMKGA